MLGNESQRTTAENYRRFARHEATGRSPLYAELTEQIAKDPGMLAFLTEQPPAKRQPNLLLGVVRYLYGTQCDYSAFRAVVLDNRDVVAEALAHRRTQTNEPARCAVLLPLLAQLPQPLALLEVGAAAGLCLLADRYSYRYGEHTVGSSDLVFDCTTYGPVPLPSRLPDVVWRMGIDLDPINVQDEEAVRWLEALVWPEQLARTARLRRAIEIARREPPPVLEGDLLERLRGVAGAAPADATLVIFHTAVLTYLDMEEREAFTQQVQGLGAEWISNEGPGVTPGITPHPDRASNRDDGFVLAHASRQVAFCDPHGSWIQWLAP
jgi:hypothetical protein